MFELSEPGKIELLMGDAGFSLKFSLRLKPRLVLKAIIAGQAAHQLATPPIIENATEILARNASHSGKVALSNLAKDLGCVKTCTREKDAEVFSLSSSPDCGRQRFSFSN